MKDTPLRDKNAPVAAGIQAHDVARIRTEVRLAELMLLGLFSGYDEKPSGPGHKDLLDAYAKLIAVGQHLTDAFDKLDTRPRK